VPKLEMHELYCLNCRECVYELEDPIGDEALVLNLLPKLGLTKKTLPTSFPNRLLRNT
jgi:hypothetical protein